MKIIDVEIFSPTLIRKTSCLLLILCFSISMAQKLNDGLDLKNDRLNKKTEQAKNIEFDIDCIITDAFAQMAFMAHTAEVNAVRMAPLEISPTEENEYGEKIYKEIEKENKFIETENLINPIRKIAEELINERPTNKTNLKYTIYLIDDSTINAFTAGGYIFINKGLLDYCKTVSELATIIAHEIGHNEKGHINLILKRIKIAGDFGNILYTIKQATAPSFNQFDEVEVDCYAVDLLYATGYDPRAATKLWKRMDNEKKEENSIITKFLMSHPYSIERYECLKQHIQQNYKNLKVD